MAEGEPNSKRRRSSRRQREHEALHAEAAHAPNVLDHPLVPATDGGLIEDSLALASLAARVREAGVLAFDTEFIGERTYFTRTCLVQVALPQGIWLVDPLGELDLTPLLGLLVDPAVHKVVHAGTPDLELAVRTLGLPPANVLDTQIAAAFAGTSYPASLRALVEELTEAQLGPGLKFSQWDHRPLTAAQRRYASDDVRYLLLLRERLVSKLEAMGNLQWALEECSRLESLDAYEPNPHARRLRGGRGRLSERERHVLRRLVEWREAEARERDITPRLLLPDEGMLALACPPAGDEEKIRQTKGVPRALKVERAAELAELIASAMGERLEIVRRPPPLTDAQRRAIEAGWKRLEELASERGVAPGMVATKKEARQLVLAAEHGRQPEGSRLVEGWRAELLAPLLRELGA